MNQPLAYVDPGAKVSNNVVIDPFTVISKNVIIQEGTWIGSNVTILEGTRIGKNVKIYPGAVIGANPQDIKFEGEDTICQIGDNTIIREHVTIHRGSSATRKTIVGKNVFLMVGCHIAHDCIIGDHAIIVNNVAMGGHCTIGEYAIISGLAALHQFATIGAHAMVGGGVLVRKDVPPYCKASKEPIQFVGINSIGLRRRGFSMEKIHEIQTIYRLLYQNNLNVTQALELIETEVEATPERDEITSFIRNSKRGIMRGYNFDS